MKINFFDKQIIREFYKYLGVISVITSIVFLFIDIPFKYKTISGIVALIILFVIYFTIWIYANYRTKIKLRINNSTVEIKFGDIFEDDSEIKAIAFNEYFDTIVDDKIISNNTLNGMFIKKFFPDNVNNLDKYIENDLHLKNNLICENTKRLSGKKKKYSLGSACLIDYEKDLYIITALTHFDDDNRAFIELKEYISFLFSFWDEVDRLYSGRTVAIPVFGSGVTRFKNYDNISDQELLELIIWSFKVSRMKFAYPSKLKIIIYKDKKDKINLQRLGLLEK